MNRLPLRSNGWTMTIGRLTFQVKNLGDIVTLPQKQKDGTHFKWFQLAAVNKDGTKCGV